MRTEYQLWVMDEDTRWLMYGFYDSISAAEKVADEIWSNRERHGFLRVNSYRIVLVQATI